MNSNPLKIFSLSTTYPESTLSKKPKFVHALNRELVKLGFQVVAICPHPPNCPKKLKMDSVLIRFFQYLPERYELSYKSIPDEIKSNWGILKIAVMFFSFFLFTFGICMKEKNYVLHGNWAFPGGFIAYLMAKIFKKKFIVTVHGSEIPLLKKFSFLKRIVVHSMNKSSWVVTSNNYLKHQLILLGVKENKIILIHPIPNFVKQNFEYEEITKFKASLRVTNHKIILFVGRLTEVKGTRFLIQSLKEIRMNNIHLIIVGEGVLSNELRTVAKTLQLEDKMTFFGAADQEELGLLYKISDVFVLPSIIDSVGGSEGTGLVILEAMESDLPVISTKVGGIPETIKDEFNGLLVNQKDPHSLAKAIERILSDNTLQERLVLNSKIILNNFSPKKIGKQYFEIFKKLENG